MGSLTLLPDFIVKIDYGRWVFAFLFYYFTVIPYFVARNDRIITDKLKKVRDYFSAKKIAAVFLMIYPVLFTPLGDWKMTEISVNILKALGQGQGIL